MVDTIRQKTIVGKNGKIELSQTQLKEGTSVEVIIVADSVSTEDETTYFQETLIN